MSDQHRQLRTYDHRLVELVHATGDITIATERGVPRSTASGWLHREAPPVVTIDVVNMNERELQAEVVKLRHRTRVLCSVVGLLLAILRFSGFQLNGVQIGDGRKRRTLLRAIDRARAALPLRAVLRVLGISASRYHTWDRQHRGCIPDDVDGCPRLTPNQLTAQELFAIKELVTSPDYRHVPSGRLAILAQRIGRVFAAPSTWYRVIKERGWLRPRVRVHPAKPKVGVRASEANQIWHLDVTIIRLLDGTKVYVHGVIDNFSRKIVAWRACPRLEAANTIAVLVEAGAQAGIIIEAPDLMVDGGSENHNAAVNKYLESGAVRRVLAQVDVRFSNSMIEAFWNSLKHQHLFLHTLDCFAAVKRLVAAYVVAHNTEVPHSAFRGQTPEEMYAGTGDKVPEDLAMAKKAAQQARRDANRASSCGDCRPRQRLVDSVVSAGA